MLALKKGVDGLSAGTTVACLEQPGKTRDPVTVVPMWDMFDSDFYVETCLDNLVELRNRTDEVPSKSRYERRADKHHIIDGVHCPRQTTTNDQAVN